MKKLICLILTAVMMFSFSISAYAEPETQTKVDEEITVYYLYTTKLSAMLGITNKKATCISEVYGRSEVTKIEVTQILQKKSGGWWPEYDRWEATYNTWYCTFTHTKSSLESGTYRVKTIANVYSGSSYETITAYSQEVTC